MSGIPSPEVEESSPSGGAECSESPAHIMEPQVELNDEFEPVSLEPNVEINEHVEPHVQLDEGADHYAYGASLAMQYYEGNPDGTDSNSNFVEGESGVQDYHSADADVNGTSHDSEETSADIAIHDNSQCNSVGNTSLDAESHAMDTSNSEAFDSSYKEEETNYSEMQRSYLEDFYSSSVSVSGPSEEDPTLNDPNIERIPLCRFPSIVKVVERAEYETLQILYQLLYQRSAWDTQEILSQRILEFSGFNFGKNSEEYYNREMMLQTLPNSILVKIGAILCLDHVKNVLSNVGLGRHDLINAILEFLALPKKKTRGPRISSKRAVSLESVEPCGCRMNCLAKFSAVERQFLAEYWTTITKKRLQDAYFVNLIKVNRSNKKSPKVTGDDGGVDSPKKTRDYKYAYKIILGNKEVDVCKGGFMMLHNVKVSRLNQLQARLKKGVWFSKADVAATLCPAAPGTEEPIKEEPKPDDQKDETSKSDQKEGTPESSEQKGDTPKSEEQDKEESNDSSVKNSTTNSVEDSCESMSSKAEDASNASEDLKVNVEIKKTSADKVPAVVVEKIDPTKIGSKDKKNKRKNEQASSSKEASNVPQEVDDKVRKKLKDFPLVVKALDEASEELLIDLHFLLFLYSAESSKVKTNILEFDGFTFGSDSEEYDERNEFLQRMSGKLITDVARSFSLGVMSKREETIENILQFLLKPDTSYLRTAPSVPVILSDVELDDIEGMSDSDESITCEVVEKKVECIDLLSSGGEDSDNEGKKKKKKQPDIKVEKSDTPKPVSAAPPVTVPVSSSSASESTSGSGIIRRLKDFETIRKIVNTHPPEYLVDIYELLFLKQHEPATLREEILSFTGFDFDKSSQDYVKRKQVLDRMLYNNVRRVYNTLIHNSTEVKVFSKPTMINEIFQFLFKLPDTDTSVRPLPPGAKTLMPKPANVQVNKPKTAIVSTPTTAAPSPGTILSSSSGKLSDLKRVFQRVACFPCEYLVDVHKLLFMSDCDPKVIRQNIFGFKGFSFAVDSPEFQQRKMYLEYLTFHSLRKISSVLTTRSVDLRNSTKHELASHLTDVLAEYCNTLVDTESIVPTVSNTPSVVTPTVIPATSSTSVENIVVTPNIEGLQSAASSSTTKMPATSSSMNISIVDTRSVSSAPVPSIAHLIPTPTPTSTRGRKRKSQTVRQIVSEKKIAKAPPAQAESQFADIHLPEVEQYQQIYGSNLNVYPNVPTITGITSFGTPVSQSFPQIVPQTMAFPFVSPYPQALQVQNIQQSPQVLGLQSTAITMPTSIITQVSAPHTEMIVPADIEKPSTESQVTEKSGFTKSSEISPNKDEEEDGDQPLAQLIGHPTDEVLEQNINDIVKKTNLQDITMNKVIQRIYNMYPHFDLSYRKDFIKSTLRTILYKLGNQNSGKKNSVRESSSPDCSVSTTGNCDGSLPESPEENS